MEGRINLYGVLEIKRAEKFKNQICPFGGGQVQRAGEAEPCCGDDCPHFGEPETLKVSGENIGLVLITICHHKRLIFDKLKDYRDGVKTREKQ